MIAPSRDRSVPRAPRGDKGSGAGASGSAARHPGLRGTTFAEGEAALKPGPASDGETTMMLGPNSFTAEGPDQARNGNGPGSTAMMIGADSIGADELVAQKTAHWGLAPEALRGAEALVRLVPTLVIYSGLRDRGAEARAWAPRIRADRQWMHILAAMRWSEDLQRVQRWLDQEAELTTAAIEARLLETFSSLSDDVMARISPHATGLAIDIAPGREINEALLGALPGVTQVLNEGDHWHIAFKHPSAGATRPGSER